MIIIEILMFIGLLYWAATILGFLFKTVPTTAALVLLGMPLLAALSPTDNPPPFAIVPIIAALGLLIDVFVVHLIVRPMRAKRNQRQEIEDAAFAKIEAEKRIEQIEKRADEIKEEQRDEPNVKRMKLKVIVVISCALVLVTLMLMSRYH